MATTRLLATDLDDTLVGDPIALAAFNRWFVRRRDHWRLAYLTGRSLSSALDLIAQQRLLLPDALVTDVGAEIYYSSQYPPVSIAGYTRDHEWYALLAAEWDEAAVMQALTAVPGLALQPEGRRPLRTGYVASDSGQVAQAQAFLDQAGLSVRVVYSSGCDLDVVPRSAGKGAALRCLVKRWQFSPWEVLVCGDSGNDLDMLTAGFPGVVVSNARAELLHAELPPEVRKSPKAHAWGILDAVEEKSRP